MSNQQEKNQKKRDQNPLKTYAKYSSIGFQMLAIVLLAVFGGMKLDDWVEGIQFPLFTLLLSIFGIALAIYHAIKDFIRFK